MGKGQGQDTGLAGRQRSGEKKPKKKKIRQDHPDTMQAATGQA